MNMNILTLFVNTFIKKYHNSFLFLNKFTNFFLIKLNSKFIKNFFDIFQLVFTEFFNLKKNFYIFTKFDFFNVFWKVNFSKLLLKTKQNKFKEILSYYFFKNNIKLIISIDFNSLRFLKLLKIVKTIKIGFLTSNYSSNFFNYSLFLPFYNFFTQFYIYYFITKLYIYNLNKKYNLIITAFNVKSRLICNTYTSLHIN